MRVEPLAGVAEAVGVPFKGALLPFAIVGAADFVAAGCFVLGVCCLVAAAAAGNGFFTAAAGVDLGSGAEAFKSAFGLAALRTGTDGFFTGAGMDFWATGAGFFATGAADFFDTMDWTATFLVGTGFFANAFTTGFFGADVLEIDVLDTGFSTTLRTAVFTTDLGAAGFLAATVFFFAETACFGTGFFTTILATGFFGAGFLAAGFFTILAAGRLAGAGRAEVREDERAEATMVLAIGKLHPEQ